MPTSVTELAAHKKLNIKQEETFGGLLKAQRAKNLNSVAACK